MIIGFTGLARSGKNTAADFIAEHYRDDLEERPVYIWSFAEKLKQSAAACFGIPKEDAIAWCDKIKHPPFVIEVYNPELGVHEAVTGREFLQNFGTEAHRDIFGSEFWVDVLMSEIIEFRNYEYDKARLDLITDARFENEAKAVHDNDGIVIGIKRGEVEAGDSHSSEAGINAVDYWIENNGTLREFQCVVLDKIGELI